jgi:hypothetical protein
LEQIAKVESAGFAFCRWGVMILVWIALIFHIKLLIVLSFFILLLSAIIGIKNAPMIFLYRYTFGKIFKSKYELLNVRAMRFAHILGSLLSLACVILLYFGNENIGWVVVWVFAIMKTISALGFCPASKLYVCMSKGGCCSFSKKLKGTC